MTSVDLLELLLHDDDVPASDWAATSHHTDHHQPPNSHHSRLSPPPALTQLMNPLQSSSIISPPSATAMTLSTEELDQMLESDRRKRNREHMQRARRKQRDQVKDMRQTLGALELRYQQLMQQVQQRRNASPSSVSSTSVDLSNNSNEDNRSTNTNARKTASERLEAAYVGLANLSMSSQREKNQLQKMIREREKLTRRIEQVMVDRQQELRLPCPLTTTITSSAAPNESLLFSAFEFTPLTEDQASARIRECYQQISELEQVARKLSVYDYNGDFELEDAPSSPSISATHSTSSTTRQKGSCPIPPSATFGWEVSSQMPSGSDFFVCCTKFFPGLVAHELMNKSWEHETHPRVRFLSLRPRVRYEVLQVLNENTYVAGIDLKHPVKEGKLMRSMDLRFRLATENGYAMGRSSVNPQAPELRALAEEQCSFEYLDSTSWISFTPRKDENSGEEGCLIKVYVRSGYNTDEDMYLRLVNVLGIAFLWETTIVPSPLRLVTPEDGGSCL